MKKNIIKTMNSKMTTHSELSTTEPTKLKQKQTKQITRTGTESEKWTSHGGISVGRGKGEIGGKRHREEA